MVAKPGRDMLLKLDADGKGMKTVAGLRAKQISLNATPVDITDSQSVGRWRELLSGAGIRHASVSGSGIFKDAESDQAVRHLFFNNQIASWQILVPGFGFMEGPFLISVLEYAGNHDSEVTFELSLLSAGRLVFDNRVDG